MKGSAIAIAMLIAFAGCAAKEDDHDEDDGREVEADDSYFLVKGEPASRNANTTADVGEKFTFENEGSLKHNVRIHKVPDPADQFVHDEDIASGAETSYTFATAGTYHVWCQYHGTMTNGMHLTVTVA